MMEFGWIRWVSKLLARRTKEPLKFTKRNFGDGNIMMWAAFSLSGCLSLQLLSFRKKSADFILALESSLIPFWNENGYERHNFQQDNARVHISQETKAWFSHKGIKLWSGPPVHQI